MKRLDYLVAKYLGWFLCPTSKQGKEEQNQQIIKEAIESYE